MTQEKLNKRKGQKQRCFISATYGTDLGQIKALLKEKKVDSFSFEEIGFSGSRISDAVLDAISRSDVFIAILGPKNSNSNTIFELGYAYSLSKPILIVISGEVKDIPSDLHGLPSIRADVNNREAISFALEQILAVQEKAKKPQNSKKKRKKESVNKNRPLGSRSDELIHELDSLSKRPDFLELERIIAKALNYGGVTAATQTDKANRGVDFAVWMDDSDFKVGGPVLIEIKRNLSSISQLDRTRNQVMHYLNITNAQVALILYWEGTVPAKAHSSFGSSVYVLSIRDFLRKLGNQSLTEVIVDCRKESAHPKT